MPGVDIIRKIQEKDTKSQNIAIFNMVESNSDGERLAVDLIKVLHIDATVSSVIRIGKQSNGSKSIRTTFGTPQAIIALLMSKKSLWTISLWNNVWTTTEITSYQRTIILFQKKKVVGLEKWIR